MPYIIIIDKSGNIKEMNIKEYKEGDLFKKANFKSPEGFLCQTKWQSTIDNKKFQVAVYGKINGKAGQENKYEFPPPIDSVLFFGGCVLTNVLTNGSIGDLRVSEWNSIYDQLMDGFENLGTEEETEEEEEEEEDILPGMKVSKDGYVCDDFVVDDEEIDYDNISAEDEEEESEEEEEEEENPIIKKKMKQILIKPNKVKPKMIEIKLETDVNTYLDYQSELSEEEYL
jgi:hypothetical protein